MSINKKSLIERYRAHPEVMHLRLLHSNSVQCRESWSVEDQIEFECLEGMDRFFFRARKFFIDTTLEVLKHYLAYAPEGDREFISLRAQAQAGLYPRPLSEVSAFYEDLAAMVKEARKEHLKLYPEIELPGPYHVPNKIPPPGIFTPREILDAKKALNHG